MDKLSLMVLFLISFPDAILVGLVGLTLLGIKPTLKQILVIGLVQAIVSNIVRILPFPFGIHALLQLAALSLLIYYVMRISYRVSLLVALSGFIIFGVIESILAPLLLSITGLSFTEVYNNSLLRFAFFVPEALSMGIVVLLLYRLDYRIAKYRELILRKDSNRSPKVGKALPLLSLFMLQNLLAILLFFSGYTSAAAGKYLFSHDIVYAPILRILIIVILVIAMIATLKRVMALLQDEIQTKADLESLRRVESLVDTIRAQRHDFSNHLQTAYGLLEIGAYQEAREYIASTVADIAVNLDLVHIDNLGIAALLYIKTAMAHKDGVRFELRVNAPLKDLPLTVKDSNVILGNLIDNALEAVSNLPENQRFIELVAFKDVTNYVLEIKNSRLITDPALSTNIFIPGLSTKDRERGFGLYSVKQTLDKYHGRIQVINDPHYTAFRILIPFGRSCKVEPQDFHNGHEVLPMA